VVLEEVGDAVLAEVTQAEFPVGCVNAGVSQQLVKVSLLAFGSVVYVLALVALQVAQQHSVLVVAPVAECFELVHLLRPACVRVVLLLVLVNHSF